MKIDKMERKNSVQITLDYGECVEISNGLYQASKTNPEFADTYAKMKFLFDMVKEGFILPETVAAMAKNNPTAPAPTDEEKISAPPADSDDDEKENEREIVSERSEPEKPASKGWGNRAEKER